MKRTAWSFVGAALLLGGCAVFRQPEPEPAPVTVEPPMVEKPVRARPEIETPPAPPVAKVAPQPRISEHESLLAYFVHVRRLSAAELAREHENVRQLYAKSRSDANRVRYAIVATVPGAAFNDDARALDALDPLLKNPDAPLHSVAFVVSAQIQEQRRSAGLQQKLEALMSLDKSLLEREKAGAKKR